MGVKDLNRLIKKDGFIITKENIQDFGGFDVLILDGSNVIINAIQRQITELKSYYPMHNLDGINKNIIFQMKFLIMNSLNNIIKNLNQFIISYNIETIYFVMDPKETPHYMINMQKNLGFIDEFKDIINPKNLDTLNLDLKANEQSLRKERADITLLIDKIANDIKESNIYDYEKSDEIYKQSMFFLEKRNSFKFIKIIVYLLINYYKNETNLDFNLVNSIDEADFVIKNIAYNESLLDYYKKILISSTDTDYYILFSEMKNIYITGLHCNDNVYNPNEIWHKLFNELNITDDKLLYKYVIRFSALIGNDYTGKTKNLINLNNKDGNDLIKLFNPFIYPLNKKRTLDKFLQKYKSKYPENETININDFDNIIHEYMGDEKFKLYLQSVAIYTKWKIYSKYNIDSENHNIENSLTWLFDNFIKELNKNNLTLLKWDYDNKNNQFINVEYIEDPMLEYNNNELKQIDLNDYDVEDYFD